MNYLESLPLHVHQQILELNGIKDSLYTIAECAGQLILFNPSDKKYKPSFMHIDPEKYYLQLTNEINAGYVKIGKNMWFNGSYTISFRENQKLTIFHIDEKAKNLLINLCKTIKFDGICAHCWEKFTLILGEGGFSSDKIIVVNQCTCGYHERHTFHKKCKDIQFIKLECECIVHRKCVKSCNTCKKIQCSNHGCQRTCTKCKDVHCQDLMFEYRDRYGTRFLCENCVVHCSHCKIPTMDYNRCKKCEICICCHCRQNLMKYGHCLPCYDTLLERCKFCEITKHEDHFVTCEQCNKNLCRDCLKRSLNPLSNNNGKIVNFDVRDACADCVVEETITITKLK